MAALMRGGRRGSCVCARLAAAVVLLCAWLAVGVECAGSKRWDHLFGMHAVEPMREGLPKGYVNVEAGPVPWFSSVFRRNTSTVLSCHQDGVVDPCVYNRWLLFWLFLGAGGSVAALLCLCGFCCGRFLIAHCGPPCCAPNCGGKVPTQEYSDIAAACNVVSLVVLLLGLGALSVFGFVSTLQVSKDLNATLARFDETRAFLPRFQGNVNYRLYMLGEAADRERRPLNGFLRGVNDSAALTRSVHLRALDLRQRILQLRRLVEGCSSNSTASDRLCDPAGTSNINFCSESGGQHTEMRYGFSSAALLSDDASRNPACRTASGARGPCPCCSTCAALLTHVDDVVAALPTNPQDFAILRSPVEQSSAVRAALVDLTRTSKIPLQTLMASPLWKFDAIWGTRGFFNSTLTVELAGAGTFGPTWLVVLILLLALLLWSFKAGKHGRAETVWWSAFATAAFSLVFILLPGITALSAVSVPLSDFCAIMPYAPTDQLGYILRALSPSGVLNDTEPAAELQGVVRECLVYGERGSLFAAVPNMGPTGVRTTIDQHLAPSVVYPPTTVSKALDIAQHAKPVTDRAALFRGLSDHFEDEMGWLPGDNCSTPPRGEAAASSWSCTAAHALYKGDLDAHAQRITAALASFTSSVQQAEAKAAELRTNVTALGTALTTVNARLADDAFAYGNCSAVSYMYQDVYTAMCGESGLVYSLDAVWACVLFLALLYVVLLPCITQSSKLSYQAREGPWRPPRPEHVRPNEIAYVRMYLDESYPKITHSTLARRNFEDEVIRALVACLRCPRSWVQVEDLRRGSVIVDLSLWAPEDNESKITCADLVEELLRQAQDPLSALYKHNVTRNCFRIESLDAHGLGIAEKTHQAAVAEHAAAAEAARARGEAPPAAPVHGAQGMADVSKAVILQEEQDAMTRYRQWAAENMKTLKGMASTTRPDATTYIPPPPLPDTINAAPPRGEEDTGIGGLVQAVQREEPFQGLRLADPEDSIFGNPLKALQEVNLEIENWHEESIVKDTPLHKACKKGRKIDVDALLKESRAGINVPNGRGQTCLFVAARDGHHEVVELLLKAGARKDAATPEGRTPLHAASFSGHAQVVEELLDWRADLEAKMSEEEYKDWTPLHVAASQGHIEIVSKLVKARANRQALTAKGESAAQIALSNAHPAVAQFLASKGASLAAEAVRRLGPQRLPETQLPGLR